MISTIVWSLPSSPPVFLQVMVTGSSFLTNFRLGVVSRDTELSILVGHAGSVIKVWFISSASCARLLSLALLLVYLHV